MSFAIGGFKRIYSFGDKTNKCTYKTPDLLSVVLGTGYFNNVAPDTLAEGDIIECSLDTDGNISHMTLFVTDVTSGVVTVSGSYQKLTATGTVIPGVMSVEANTTAAATVTIASALNHQDGLFTIKNTTTGGTDIIAFELTAGTWDGTNNTASTNAGGEGGVFKFDSDGNGMIVENIGTITFG